MRSHSSAFCVQSLATTVAITLYKSKSVTRLRWEQWLWTCVFALLPLLLWLLLVQVIGVEGNTGAAEASRELLFFSLAICTIALYDLRNVDAAMRSRSGYESFYYASIVEIASSAALYGVFLSVHTSPKLLSKILSFSIGTAVICLGVSTWTQTFIHRGENNAAHS